MTDDQIYYADYCKVCAAPDRYCFLHNDEEGGGLRDSSDDIDPVEYAEKCERMASDLVASLEYDDHTRALLRTGVPDLADTVREQASEIERLRRALDEILSHHCSKEAGEDNYKRILHAISRCADKALDPPSFRIIDPHSEVE